ncbi:MAG: hypothetical protein HRU17_10875 [Polyangiaceae bacterium]|nr:hypothetical protein [Polyangiaceae bacterium]
MSEGERSEDGGARSWRIVLQGAFASAAFSASDWLFVTLSPFAQGNPVTAALVGLTSYSAVFPFGVAMAFVCDWLARRPWVSSPEPEVAVATTLLLVPGVAGLRVIHRAIADKYLEFPRPVEFGLDVFTLVWGAGFLLLAMTVARGLRRFSFGVPFGLLVLSVLATALALALMTGGQLGPASVYETRPLAFIAVGALTLFVVAVQLAPVPWSSFPTRGVAALSMLVALTGLFADQHSAVPYLSYSRAAAIAPFRTALLTMVDWDRDGAAPSWLGGTDCAPTDGSVGPLAREVPGDGIDQDCDGQDAPLNRPAPKAENFGKSTETQRTEDRNSKAPPPIRNRPLPPTVPPPRPFTSPRSPQIRIAGSQDFIDIANEKLRYWNRNGAHSTWL